MWAEGKRLKWFTVDRTRPIMNQLKSIEEQVLSELKTIDETNYKLYAFHSPPRFYERLAQSLCKADEMMTRVIHGVEAAESSRKHSKIEEEDPFDIRLEPQNVNDMI